MKRNQGMKIKRRHGFNFLWMQMAGALMLLAAAPTASAATYYWDSDGTTAGFGTTTGTWGTSAFWTETATGGSPHSAVTATLSADTVNFGTATLNYGNGTVGVLAGGVTANKIVFGAAQTNALTVGSAGTITLGGASPSITVNSTGHKISSPIVLNPTSGGTTISYHRGSAAVGIFTIDGQISGNSGGMTFTTPSAGFNNPQTINLGNAATYTGDTTLDVGHIKVPLTLKNTSGVADVLPTTTVLTFGTGEGFTGGRATTFDLNGQNQTLAGLSNLGAVPILRNHIVTSTNAATLTINNTANYIFGGATLSTENTSAQITGAISLVKTGAGTLTLSGTLTSGATEEGHTYTGTTEIKEGILSASKIVVTDGNSHLGNAASAVTLGAASTRGTLTYTGTSATYTRGFTIGGAGGGRLRVTTAGQTLQVDTGDVTGSGLFTVGGAGSTAINANLTHDGGLTKADAGTLTLTGDNTYSGPTTVSAGTLTIGGAGRLGSGTYAGAITNNAVFTYDSTSDQTLSGVISGTGALIKTNASTLTLAGTNTYSGNTIISNGVLVATSTGSLGNSTNVTVFANNGGWLTLSNNAAISTNAMLAILSGSGKVTVAAGVTATVWSLWIDGVQQLDGTWGSTSSSATHQDDAYFAGAGTIMVLAGGPTAATKTWAGNTDANFNTGANWNTPVFYSGDSMVFTNAGSSGTSLTNDLTSLTPVAGITFTANSPGYTINGNAIKLTGDISASSSDSNQVINLPVKLSSGTHTITTKSLQTITLGGLIYGAGGLTKANLGTVTLSATNTFSGALTIEKGTVIAAYLGDAINGQGTIAMGSGGNNGVLAYTGSDNVSLTRAVNLGSLSDGGAVLDVSGTGNLTFNAAFMSASTAINKVLTLRGSTAGTGTIAAAIPNHAGGGALSVSKTGTGTWILSGTNTYSGATTVSAGMLTIGGAGKLGFGEPYAGAITNNAVFQYDSTSDQNLSGVISGTGLLFKANSSTLTLSGTNTYSGATIISAGMLTIGAYGRLGSGTYAGAITNNGTIKYNSTHDQTLSGVMSGTGALFITDVGTLTLTGTNTYSGATTIRNGTLMGVVGGSCANSAVTNTPGSGVTASLGVSVTDPTKQWICQSLTTDGLGTPTLTFDFGAVTPSSTLAPLNVVGAAAFTVTPKVVVTNGVLEQKAYPLMTWGSTSGTPPGAPDLILGAGIKGGLSVVGNTLYLMLSKGTVISLR